MHDASQQMMAMQSMLMRRLMQGLADTELSAGQPKVLAYLRSHEGKPQKEIAAACMIEPGSLTVLLARMEKQDLIERRFREGDRRARCIYLTDRGRTLAARVIDEFYAVEQLAFSGISEEERALFLRVCGEILKNLRSEDADG